MKIIPLNSYERIEQFITDNKGKGMITTLSKLWRNELKWGRYILGAYNEKDDLIGICGFGINEYHNVEPSFTLVSLECRKQGIAKALKMEQEEVAKRLSVQRIYSVVKKSNKASQHLLLSLGYFPYREGETIYHFVKQIGDDKTKLPKPIKIERE